MAGEDRLRELEERYEGYKVYDNNGESIGKVDDLFVDEQDREEYVGVKMGLFGLSGTTLIPLEIMRVNDRDRVIEVSESKEHVKDAPQYSDDDEIDVSFEERIRSHFGLTSGSASSGSYDPTGSTGAEGAAGDNTARGEDMETTGSRDSVGREEYRNDENYVSDSAMGAAAGGAMTSGGRSDFETGEREDRGGYREGDPQGGGQDRQSAGEGSQNAGQGMEDAQYREAYIEGYREAIRESSGQTGGASGSMRSEEGQGGRTGDREGASEHSGASDAGRGDREFDGTRDYEDASTGFQPGRSEGGEGRTRVRRVQRGS